MNIQINDIYVYYEIIGDGVPVIMLHGWGVDHRLLKGALEPVFEKSPSPYKRIYFDLPGMGKTPGTKAINGSDMMLKYIIQTIDAIIPDKKFLLVGNSYGGYLSRALIKKMPERILGLCLIVASKRPFIPTENGFDKGDVPEHQVTEYDEAFLSTLSAEQRNYFQFLAVKQTADAWHLFQKDVLPGILVADQNFLENHLSQNTFLSNNPDEVDFPFTRPSLIICGRQDSMTGYRDIYKILNNYPRASFSVLDGSGHNLPTERPAVFHELVKDWLQRVEYDKRLSDILL